jgi:predicted outer membrane protein
MTRTSRLTIITVFALAIFLFLNVVVLSAQKPGPISEPAEMSGSFNPLLWKGTDAEFALKVMHSSYCQTELSKAVLQKSGNAQVKDVANTLVREQGALNKGLKRMARTINFPIPHNEKNLAACPDAAKIAALSPNEIDKAYLSFMATENATATSRFQTEWDEPKRSYNYDLQAFVEKTLPTLEKQKDMIAARH